MTRTRLILAGVLILIVTIIGTAYVNDHVSCVRSQKVRTGLHIFFVSQEQRADARAPLEHGLERALDVRAATAAAKAAAAEGQLKCGALSIGET